jgi:hypothetical protein
MGTTATQQTAGFGWEVTDLHNDGADVIVPVKRALILQRIDYDCSFMITALSGAGFVEVLYTVGVATGTPTFSAPPPSYISLPASPDFGSAQFHNPSGVKGGFDGSLEQGSVLRLILKAWCPTDGTASQSARHVTTYPALPIAAGSSLVFHMDHAGVQVDSEMQVSLGYTLQA